MTPHVTDESPPPTPPALAPARTALEWGVWTAVVLALLYFGLLFRPVAAHGTVRDLELNPRERWFGIAVQPGAVWMVGSEGRIVRSGDASGGWQRQSAGVGVGLQDVAAWSAEQAVAVGEDGTTIRTADGGRGWSMTRVEMPVAAGKLMRVVALAGGHAVAAGESSTVLASHDFGATWKRIHEPSDHRWYGLAARSERHIVVVGEFGRIAASTDAGATWQTAPLPEGASLMSVAFDDAGVAVAVGLEGRMLRSTDGGHTWAELPKTTDKHLFDVARVGANWLAVGNFVRLVSADGLSWRPAVAPGQRTFWLTEVSPAATGGEALAVGEAPVRLSGDAAHALYSAPAPARGASK